MHIGRFKNVQVAFRAAVEEHGERRVVVTCTTLRVCHLMASTGHWYPLQGFPAVFADGYGVSVVCVDS